MTMKKLTVAAAIAVGIASCSLNQAMAACPCPSTGHVAPCEKAFPDGSLTGPACPVQQTTTNCNPCKKEKKKEECPCKKQKEKKCKPDCKSKAPKCKKEPKCAKTKEPTCLGAAAPTAAVCPGGGKPERKDMRQVYAYPNAVYGTNNYMGEAAAGIASIETPYVAESFRNIVTTGSGVVVASGCPATTGAAAQIPCLSNSELINGIPVATGSGCANPVNIQSSSSMEATKTSFSPFTYSPTPVSGQMTGAAAGLPHGCQFPDVPNSFWASCDIDKLAMNDVVVGYPDGYFRPARNISRAEFATILVKGFNLNCGMTRENLFKDVPASNWANPAIAKAVDENLLAGYPNGTFRPNAPVTRVEALSTISKGMTCEMDECKANEILSKYADGNTVPQWARIPVAKSLENGALKDMPNPHLIAPNKDASRADVASMMQTVRVALGYDTNPKTANEICPVCPEPDRKAFMEDEEMVTIPTLQISMLDQITSKSSHVGQHFRAKTLEDITINGVTYPCGSTVSGQVVEVIRPSGCEKGALKLSFTDIKNGDCKATLPKQILTAQINKDKQVNPVARAVEFPFTLAGTLVGTAARTVGGAFTNLGNAVENVSNDVGYTFGNVFNGELGAAGRSLGDGAWELVKAPVDVVRTAVSGTMGLFQTTGDEIAYLVDPKGQKISAVNPRERLTIAFGCPE